MRISDVLALLMLLATAGFRNAACATDYYVAQEDAQANDANPGTLKRPFRTVGQACKVATAGDTVYVLKGVYREPLIPKHSGEKGKPIIFQAYADDTVTIKGSETLSGLEKEGPNLWVKRPWTRANYWEDWMKQDSVAPYGSSARIDEVFVNEQPLQWVPSRAELKPGCFVWTGASQGGELVIYPPAGIADLSRALVEIPVLSNVLGAWEGDPGGLADVRDLRRSRPQHEWARRQWPEIHYIHIKGLRFRHAAHTLNRAGVRLDGDHWLLEDCIAEFMNANGIVACGDYGVVRRCIASHNGQSGLGSGSGTDNLFEDVTTLYNNRKLFSIDWGGAGNKLCQTRRNTVRGLVSAFNYGSGLWHDIDCRNTVVEDCLAIGNRPVNAGFFYEISSEGTFRRNVSFANYGRGGEFYGCGFVLSASGKTVVEDNVVIGGSGGISVGNADRDDVHPVVENTIQRNLVVEPELAAMCVESGKRDPTAPEANNRFLANTFLVSGADSRLAFGSRRFTSADALDEAAAGAQGNRSPSDLTQLDKATAERLNDALKRVLNALKVADARLDVGAPSVHLEAIWRLRGSAKATGYWLRTEREHYLLLDVAVPGEIRLTGSGTPLLWDFPVLRAPVRVALARVEDAFAAHVEGPCALVIGLGGDASPGQTPVE
ncbi:MAG: right-handed parallel beta-helix repeat-containing protein [Planctomycetota bacterium]|nr:right-handed parallel beta-helix repeat-containing protein [Planctomycetota bacterium]